MRAFGEVYLLSISVIFLWSSHSKFPGRMWSNRTVTVLNKKTKISVIWWSRQRCGGGRVTGIYRGPRRQLLRLATRKDRRYKSSLLSVIYFFSYLSITNEYKWEIDRISAAAFPDSTTQTIIIYGGMAVRCEPLWGAGGDGGHVGGKELNLNTLPIFVIYLDFPVSR